MTSIGIVLFCLIIATVTADGPSLVIKPGDGTQKKALDDRLVFVCILPSNINEAVSNFQWLDPRNLTIDENYRTTRDPNIRTRGGNTSERLLEFEKLSEQEIGAYTCVATVGSKTMSAVMNIVTFRKITFVDAPTDQLATIGSKYKIKCEVQADPPPRVEWTRNNVILSNSQNYIVENDGLVINGVRESDDGEYNCEAFVLDTGEVKNRNIHLEVIAAPKIINTPEFQFITEGEKATIVCQATGKPKPEIRWIKGTTHEVVSKGVDGILYFEKVSKEDNIEYTCEAKNKAGEARKTVHLSVKSKPDVIDVRNGTAKVGTFAQVQCIVYANPKPSVVIKKYTLRRDRRDVDSQTRSVVAVQARTAVEVVDDPTRKHVVIATMNFTSVERYDDGLYECTAENDVGRSVRMVHLTVETPPVFEDKVNIKEIFSWGSREVNLTCVAEAIPNATITWSLNNRLIERNDQFYTIFGKGSPSTLQIKPLDKRVYGAYKCKADNKHGTAYHDIHFKEAFPPASLGGTYDFNTTTATSVTIRIPEPLNTGGLRIKGYLVQYKKDIDQWNEAANETWPYGAAYVIRNLNPSTRYEFRIAAFNEVGYSGYSDTKGLLTPDMSAPSEPTISAPLNSGEKFVKLETAKTLELRWQIPPSNGAEIDRYELKYCMVHENADEPDGFDRTQDDTSCKTQDLLNNEVLSSYTIADLIPETYYRVELKAHNNIGSGQPSSRVFKTNISSEPTDRIEQGMSSAVIIYIVVAILIAVLVIVDVSCFFFGNTGVLFLLCGGCCGKKKKNSDDKLGSETKDLISNGHKKIDIEEQAPMITDGTKKDTAVEYDVKKGTSRTGFVGKDSAV